MLSIHEPLSKKDVKKHYKEAGEIIYKNIEVSELEIQKNNILLCKTKQ